MLRRPLTEAEIRTVFDRHLMLAQRSGRGCPDGIGLHPNTVEALNGVAREYPNPSSATIARAKAELQRQLPKT